MDTSVFWLVAMLGAGWFFTFTIGFNAGIRFERFRRDKEVDAYVIPEEDLEDGAYWKLQYEDLAASIPDSALNQMDNEREANAPGETT